MRPAAGGDRSRPLVQGAGQNKDGVDAAHFRVARDGLRALRRQLHQRGAAGKGPGKSHSLDCGMLHQLDTHLDARIEEQRKHTLRQAARLDAPRE